MALTPAVTLNVTLNVTLDVTPALELGLTWWWAIPVWLAAAAVVVLVWRRRPGRSAARTPVAHSDRLATLPSYAFRRRLYQVLTVALALALALALGAAAVVTARPTVIVTTSQPEWDRDTLVCLDVSGSMWEADAAVLDQFATLGAADYAGQRVALMTFDAAPVVVFPLTDDYDLVQATMAAGARAFAAFASGTALEDATADWAQFTAGTAAGGATSAAGDGLASCVGHLGTPEPPRTQAILFVTDNFHGDQVYSVAEAAALAARRGVRVYVLYADAWNWSDAAAEVEELRQAAAVTGGTFYDAAATAPAEVVDALGAVEAARSAGAPRAVVADAPGTWLIVAWLASLGVVLVAWRLRQ
ncbi:MAG: VWA domain-containing protein [Propionibacteriaceae bacterium]|jgi:hypothetical protein|nr:VWA domain-containing protein [Propionibacteriaceae bacterium]